MQFKPKLSYCTVIILWLGVPMVLLLSCSSSSDKEAASNSTEENTTLTRSDTIDTEISIEGMTETMQMYLLESPDRFPLSFSTYIPMDMKVEKEEVDEATAMHIIAVFGGRLNKKAQLTIGVFAPGIIADTAYTRARKKAQSFASLSEDPERYPWAQTVYSLQGDRFGFLALAQKNGRWFYLLASYPPEYGDGMGPRIHKIIEHWRWQDTGNPLEG